MRIAQIMAGLEGGGAELFFERLSLALAGAGDAVLPVTRPVPARLDRLRTGGLAPLALPFGGLLDLRTGAALRRALRCFRPDVAIAWMGRAARVAPRGDWVLAGRLGGYYDLGRFRRCTHLIANTAPLAAWIERQGWPATRVHHLPNFSADPATCAPERLGVPAGTTLVLALGRLHRNKGFDVLICAAARLPGVALVIAGEGPERAALEAVARACGVADRLLMPGWRDDAASLIAGCDLLVCPSRHEPLGNVVIEAMAGGRPIVAAASEGPADLLEHGRTGWLVPPDDERALADAIEILRADRAAAAALGRAARAVWSRRHAPDAVLGRWRDGLALMRAGG